MKTRSLVLLIILGCGGLFVAMFAVCAGVLFFAYRSTDAAVSPKVDALFAKIDDGTFDDAYLTETSPEMRATVSKEKWVQIGMVVKSRLGRLQSKSMRQFNANQFNTTTTMSVVYDATFAKGSGTISVQYSAVSGEWRLDALYVKSPVLDVILQKCPHCGELTPASAKFCTNCGKPMKDGKGDKAAAPPATRGKSK